MKVVYFGDMCGDLEEEANQIKEDLAEAGIQEDVEIFDIPQVLETKFDVLFFDWGGMSIGNSLLEHFCANIIDHAIEHPSRIYIMNSMFTEAAMKDALYDLKDKPANVFLQLKDALPYLK